MTEKEMRLIAWLLDMAADEFGNHGCNDLDSALLREFTVDEKESMAADYGCWNGDPDYQPEFKWIGDSSLMRFMAYKLKVESVRVGKLETK